MEYFDFPEEIITEILSRLPVDSVLECRRVCKTWRTLTYLPPFARLHLLQQSPKNLHDYEDDYCTSAVYSSNKVGFVSLINLKNVTKSRTEKNILIQEGKSGLYCGEFDTDEKKVSYKTLRLINHPTLNSCNFQLLSSCNGLICFLVNHRHGIKDPEYIYICNPITREYINLPTLKDTPPEKEILNTSYGFGYLPKTNEYKVVRIYYPTCVGRFTMLGQVEVYTLGSGSGWRNKGKTGYICRDDGVLANGALHWSNIQDGKFVSSFDLADEEFHLLPAPPCQLNHCKLLELRGLLCAHSYRDECIRIWSLKKINSKKNSDSHNMMKEQEFQSWVWSIEFCIQWEGIHRHVMYEYDIFSVRGNGELLLWRSRRALYRYNLKTKSLDEVVDYYVRFFKFFNAIPHINSFISLRALGEDAGIIRSAEGVLAPPDSQSINCKRPTKRTRFDS